MIDNFRADLEKAGYRFDGQILADDQWHRCYYGDETKSSGRYRLKIVDEKFALGNFGSDKDPDGFRSWHNRMGSKQFSAAEKLAYKQKIAAEKNKIETEREAKQKILSRRLELLYNELPVASGVSSYLVKKKILAHGIKTRINKRSQEELIIPIYQEDGKIWNFQRITAGWKGFFKGAKINGGHFYFGDPKDGNAVLICEGFATGASIYEATGIATVSAFTANNLENVAKMVKKFCPRKSIIFCADNDAWTKKPNGDPWNPGIEKAQNTAASIGGAKVIWPEFADVTSKPTDFNDLHALEGLEAVKNRIETVLPSMAPDIQVYDISMPEEGIPFDDVPQPEYKEPPRDFRKTTWPFQILGYNEGMYYFLPNKSFQVVELNAGGITNIANLFRLAPMDFWKDTFGGEKITSRKIAEIAANAMIEKAHDVGIFDATKMRGIGAWLDKGRVIIHAGEELIVDGVKTSLQHIKSKYIYPLRVKSFPAGSEPLNAKEAGKLREICEKLSWENKLSGELLAGWIVIAPICGALDWRPHIWIEGESESGKTTIIEKIITPMMAGAAMRFDGGTTEAAVRQLLGIDAVPIIYDEAEPENQKDRGIMEGLLLLARRSSKGGILGKGGANGKGESYIMRSCFCFAGINPAIKQRADESRISRLVIKKADFADNEEFFRELKKMISSTITPEYAERLLARTIKLLPIIIKNCEVFTDAAADELSNRRAADQIGVLLAGLYSLTSSKEITYDAAIEFIGRHQWTQHTAIEENKDWERLIAYLTGSRIRYKNQEKFIGEIIETAWKEMRNKNIYEPDPYAAEHLRYYGIWIKPDGVWILNKCPQLEEVFRGTPWENNWSGQLRNVPDVTMKKPTKFATGTSGRSLCVPYKAFDIDDTGYTENMPI